MKPLSTLIEVAIRGVSMRKALVEGGREYWLVFSKIQNSLSLSNPLEKYLWKCLLEKREKP